MWAPTVTNPPWPDGGPNDPDRNPGDSDIDAVFAAIVAGWDREADPDHRTPPTTSAPAAAGGTAGAPNPAPPEAPPEPPVDAPAFALAPQGWRVHVPPDDDQAGDDGFEPPDPPLPRGDLRFWLAVGGLVLGPVVFIVWALTGPHSTTLPYVLAGLGTVAGFAAVISQLPERHDEDDDGARV